jgi:hypothetical protein
MTHDVLLNNIIHELKFEMIWVRGIKRSEFHMEVEALNWVKRTLLFSEKATHIHSAEEIAEQSL